MPKKDTWIERMRKNMYQRNQIGTQAIKLRQEAVASAQQAYNALKDRQTREFLNNVNTQQSKSPTNIQKQAKALHTAQTDKTFVPAVGRRQNPELNAIPVKEDNTGPLGYAAAIAPFAVASAPFAAATPTIFANPYVQAAINSYFAAEGVDDIINGRANWSTPINFLPFYGGATKTLANTPRYSIKGGNVRTRVRDVENSVPRITRDNAATMTPEQWTAAQDAAIARGDIEEAQRLRDLHFVTKAPNTVIKNVGGMPAHVYHGTTSKPFTVFDINAPRKHDLGTYGKGFYFTPNKGTAVNYGDNKTLFDTYLNLSKPYTGSEDVVGNIGNFKNLKQLKNYYKKQGFSEKELDSVDWGNFDIADGVNAGDEIMVLKNNQIKLADAVTYDDNGIRIPLGKRDNFKVNDIRYSILPLIGGSILYNNSDRYNHSLGGQLRKHSLKSVKHMF